MKEKLESTTAVIFVIMHAIFMVMTLTAEYGSAMNPIEQQIQDESMIM